MLKSKIKKFLSKAGHSFSSLKPTVKCKNQWYGSEYGGFYISPDFINEDSIIYSFGLGQDISFDTEIIEKHNCHVFGFDPTPKSVKWLRKLHLPSKFHLHEYGIGKKSGVVSFYLPKNPEFVSGSILIQNNILVKNNINVKVKSLADISNDLGHECIDVLKMDIEGSEYEVIENILQSNLTINQILVEFHDRFFKEGRTKSRKIIRSLKDHGYEIFAVSPSFEEVSFIKKSLLEPR